MSVVKLASDVPLVWRSPTALQIGHPPIALLDPLSDVEERLIAALVKGAPRSALPVIGRCGTRRAEQLLSVLEPALEQPPAPTPIAAVRVRSRDRGAIIETLRALGLLHRDARVLANVGLIVADHVIPWTAYRAWMRADVPHVGVTFGHESVTVSNLVVPGRTACLRCADMHRVDADEAWPALASQLLAAPARTARDPLLRGEALAAASRILRQREPVAGLELAADGTSRAVPLHAHEDCACTFDLQAAMTTAPASRRRRRLYV